jgi:NTE family protein
MDQHQLGLALSGGGARGIAHAGVLHAFDEMNIPVNIISGTSSGAIIGVLYAAGVKPTEMENIVKKKKLFDIKKISFDFKGILKTGTFHKIIQEFVPMTTFEELGIPVIVCATDFNHAKSVFFEAGKIEDVVVASCSIPIIFSPTIIKGRMMVDGGLLNNFPVEPLVSRCKNIVGVNVNPLGTFVRKNFSGMLERCFQMAISSANTHKISQCNLFIEPPDLSNFRVFDTKKANEIFDIGYKETMKNRKILEDLLKN